MTRLFRNLLLVMSTLSLLMITCSLAVSESLPEQEWESLLYLSDMDSHDSHLHLTDIRTRLVLKADPFEQFNIVNTLVFIRRSPNGSRYAAYDRGAPDSVYITDGETLEVVREERLETLIGMAWSPDNETVAFVSYRSSGNPTLLTIRNREVRELTTLPYNFGTGKIGWSPDGTQIALIGGHSVFLINARTGKYRVLITHPEFSYAYPAWSPDGSRIVYHVGGAEQRLEVLDVTTSEIETINTDVFGHVYHLEWSQDGNSVGFWMDVDDNSGDLLFYEVDLRNHSIRQLYTLPESLRAYIMDWVKSS